MKKIFLEATKTSYDLFKIMVPVIVIVHLLKHFDLIKYFAVILSPFMKILDLPPEVGIVWAMAMLNNIYGGLIVFSSLGITDLTMAQASTLGMLMLVAHNLPIELLIAKKCGLNLKFQLVFRIASAIAMAGSLSLIYSTFNIFQDPAKTLVLIAPPNTTLVELVFHEVTNLVFIFVIIFLLMTMMSFLKHIGFLNVLNTLLKPLLKPLNINEKARPLTVVGLTLGLTYGAGLIVNAVKNEELDKKSTFLSLSMMGICHALIEDSFLVLTLGGELFGILCFRMFMGYILIYILGQLKGYLKNDLSSNPITTTKNSNL